jgi:hypothetical protein
MSFNRETISKASTYFGYGVYAATVVFGIYLILGNPAGMTATNPSHIQIAGVLLICYGLVEVAVTSYNRLPPLHVKTDAERAVDKAKIRERNDAKSRERKSQKEQTKNESK